MTELTTTPEPTNSDWLSRPLLAAYNIDWEKVIYILFLLIAIVTRFWDLGGRVMSHDESLHTQFSYQFFIGDGYSHTPLMHGPFLFHATALSYWLFGDSDLSARIPVAVFGVLLVAIPYYFRPWIGKVGALFTSFIFLISPYITYYSRYIRHDIYVIVWALIVVLATLYYLQNREEKYLWWFAAGVGLMFATKEVSFIYVAIFGSYMIIRLLPQLLLTSWLKQARTKLALPVGTVVLGLAIVVIGLTGLRFIAPSLESDTTALEEPALLAVDPAQETAVTTTETAETSTLVFRWTQVAGIFLLSLGLFLIARNLRPFIEGYAEYDLIILFTTLMLPTASPFLTFLAGWNPRDYSFNICQLEGQATMSAVELFFNRIGNRTCVDAFLDSGWVHSGIFLFITLLVSVLVGIWWHRRRWLTAAAIFYAIITVLYTSVFTNPGGWLSGVVGSLGYWLEQQEVARGSQPPFYYFIVVPLYEFLPLIFSLLAVRLWMIRQRVNHLIGYWISIGLLALLAMSFTNWWINRPAVQAGAATTNLPGYIAAFVIIGGGLVFWFLWQRTRLLAQINADNLRALFADHLTPASFIALCQAMKIEQDELEGENYLAQADDLIDLYLAEGRLSELVRQVQKAWPHLVRDGLLPRSPKKFPYQTERSLFSGLNREMICEIVPFAAWWLLVTAIAYTVAGEKMPWLSTHFVIPMGLLTGWYFNEKLRNISLRQLLQRRPLLLWSLSIILIVATFLAVGPVLLGQIQFGDQAAQNLSGIGRFFGGLLAVGLLFYLWQQIFLDTDFRLRSPVIMLSIFGLLSLLTIRFTYMANFVNENSTTEYLVYAHGAPATKEVVLTQLEELSMRLHGDKSIKVAYDNDSSWPFTWYLREYPNRIYFGETPSTSITEAPVVIVGSNNWSRVEPFLRNDYEESTYTFLWWPMEEYRKIGWEAIFGNEQTGRGLLNPGVREALWNIFFYRDFTRYGEIFGGTYSAGQWPLRHDLKMYIRRDVLAELWDYGVGATNIVATTDPYAENILSLSPEWAINATGVASGGDGGLSSPRNLTVGPDGRLYVLDSGNRRVAIFDLDGQFITAWGSEGVGPGQFLDEPWGIQVDSEFVYVADTWNHRIQKFTLDGEFVASYGQNGLFVDNPTQGLGAFYGPRAIVSVDDNYLLVTDTGNHRLQYMSKDGEFLNSVGNQGSLLGQVFEPVGLAVAPDGSIYLADTWNGRIQKFTSNLQPLSEWRVDAWIGQSINNKPYIAVDSAGRVYITDPEGFRVIVFDGAGNYLAQFGTFGTDINSFGLPNGIALDADDNIYIADAANNRVLKFAPLFGAVQPIDSEADTADDAADLLDPDSDSADDEAAADEDSDAVEEDSSDGDVPTPTEVPVEDQ